MPRDHRKLRAFIEADDLIAPVYEVTADLPPSERYGLQTQIRRGALSIPTNIVEGCSRKSAADYLRFIEIAFGSAKEVAYLFEVTVRLKFLKPERVSPLISRYEGVKVGLFKLLEAGNAWR